MVARSPNGWWVPWLGLSLLAGLPFFFWGGPGYYSSRSFKAAWDLGHVLFFALLSVWLHAVVRAKVSAWSPFRLFVTLFIGVFLAGVTAEGLQMRWVGRSPDIDDVLRNQLGCLTAFAFFIRPALLRHTPQRWFRVTVSLALCVTLWPLSRALIDESLAARQFPVLADFETPFERYRWNYARQLRKETETVRHGNTAMRVQLSTAKYSGVALFYFPGDWRGYATLHCSVYNPQPAGLVLNCRIHDTHHKEHGSEFSDRFNQQFILRQGWNDLVVSLDKVKNAPRSRSMDMGHIEGFGLFVVQQDSPMEVYLDHVYLGR